MHALLITPDDTVATIDIDDRQQLEQLQAAVGGWIEVHALTETAALVINEEGKIQRLPVNDIATRLTQHYDIGLVPWDLIVGPAVVVGVSGPEYVDAPADVVDALTRLGFTIDEKG